MGSTVKPSLIQLQLPTCLLIVLVFNQAARPTQPSRPSVDGRA